jgi:hypothetical protein
MRTTAAIGKSAIFLTSKRKSLGTYKNFPGKSPVLLTKMILEAYQNRTDKTRHRISQNIFYSHIIGYFKK